MSDSISRAYRDGSIKSMSKADLQAELKRIKDRLQEIEESSRSTFGRNVRRYRHQCDLTQEELAEKLGCVRVTILNIERGTANTTIHRLMKLCQVLGVTPNDLLLEADDRG